MKRVLLLLSLSLFVFGLCAQQRVVKNTNEANYVTIIVTNADPQVVTATFTRNSDCHHFDCLIGEESVMEGFAEQYNTTIDLLVSAWGFHDASDATHTFTELKPNTEYVLYARSFGSDSVAYSDMDTIHIKTAVLGGNGIANIQVEINNIQDSSAVMVATPNDQTAVFYDGMVTKELFEQVGQDSAVKIIQNNQYPHHSIDTWTWSLKPNTEYKAIAVGQNALNEWGEPTIVDFTTLGTIGFVNIDDATLKIYPQPSNGNFVIESPSFIGKMISIYDIKGGLVHQELWKATRQEINLPELNGGTYLLQVEQGRMVRKILIKK